MNRLALISAQDALILLRASFSAPRVQHLMRCSPSANNSFLQTFEFLGRQLIASLTPPCQTFSEKGDLASNSRLLGFSCRHPLRPGSNLRGVCACQTDSHFTSYLTEWSASFGPPPDRMPSKQSFCVGPIWNFGGSFHYPSFFGRSVACRWHTTWL